MLGQPLIVTAHLDEPVGIFAQLYQGCRDLAKLRLCV